MGTEGAEVWHLRVDYACLRSRCLIEVEGGIWVNGRHNRAAGFNADWEKYLETGLAGWRVFRLGPNQIALDNEQWLVALLRQSRGSSS
jgi:very-short-patch-repair endonuclease